jgi:outer membrane protein OmpA-like peptidoglycan-associated protein
MRSIVLGLSAAALLVSGCANMSETQTGTAKGAGAGAVAGAILGAATAGGNRGKSATTGAAVGAGVGALGGYIWSKRMEDQKARMEEATRGTGIEVARTNDNRIKAQIPSDAGFDVGRASVRPQLGTVLTQFAQGMRDHQATQIHIVGHTDSTGTDSINNPLSLDRAGATRDYLVARGGPATRITIDGRGSREPVAGNDTAQGRAQNRRVEIFVAEPQQLAGAN